MTPNYIESLSSLFQENDSLKKSVEKINREYERQKEALIKTTEEFIRTNHLYLELKDIQIANIESNYLVQIKHPLFFQETLHIKPSLLLDSLHGYSTLRLKFSRLYMVELNQTALGQGHLIWVSYLTVPPIENSDTQSVDISLKPLLDQYPAYTKKE